MTGDGNIFRFSFDRVELTVTISAEYDVSVFHAGKRAHVKNSRI
jgi:hypothetical protein